jgi:hypothetical protein
VRLNRPKSNGKVIAKLRKPHSKPIWSSLVSPSSPFSSGYSPSTNFPDAAMSLEHIPEDQPHEREVAPLIFRPTYYPEQLIQTPYYEQPGHPKLEEGEEGEEEEEEKTPKIEAFLHSEDRAFGSNRPHSERTHKKLPPPVITLIGLVPGIAFAVVHHFYYSWLDGKVVGDAARQQWALR